MSTTKLSVNINKIATLRNSRGGSIPSVTDAAIRAEQYGAQGITVHPRPDERHIRYSDVRELKPLVTTEFNVEGYPSEDFLKLVLEVQPTQVTLVPDPPGVLTSNAGWDTIANRALLQDVTGRLKEGGMRVSIFVDPEPEMVEAAKLTGTDRVELYTEAFAVGFPNDREKAIAPYILAADTALRQGIGLNAGHDLNLQNLAYFKQHITGLLEVSIGHALIADALYVGLSNAIRMYLAKLE
jgi:pyridoxine 5-phosphate synthase